MGSAVRTRSSIAAAFAPAVRSVIARIVSRTVAKIRIGNKYRFARLQHGLQCGNVDSLINPGRLPFSVKTRIIVRDPAGRFGRRRYRGPEGRCHQFDVMVAPCLNCGQAHGVIAPMGVVSCESEEMTAAERNPIDDNMHMRVIVLRPVVVKRRYIVMTVHIALSIGIAMAENGFRPVAPGAFCSRSIRTGRKADDKMHRQIMVQYGIGTAMRKMARALVHPAGKGPDSVGVDRIRCARVELVALRAHQ
ncbi:hypothetical protein BC361_20865 [Ensifer sp. LC54]|nr:hypothetical protein BC363_24385 [Ensifer sp. LC384]OCP24260.1 hypothetical protein BC361_20865 [Ensifer sp. LC54]